MAVTIVRPNADPPGATLQWSVSSGTSHYQAVDDVASEPSGTDTDGINLQKSGAAGTAIDEIGLGTIASVGTVSEIKMWVRGLNAGFSTATVYISIFVDGTWEPDQVLAFDSSETWKSAIFTPSTSWDQTDMDNLKFRLKWVASGFTIGLAQVKIVYASVTHSAGGGGGGPSTAVTSGMFMGLLV